MAPSDEQMNEAMDRIAAADEAVGRKLREMKARKGERETRGRPRRRPMLVSRGDAGDPRRSPIHILVDRLGDEDDEYLTTAQVAEAVGVSPATIRRLSQDDEIDVPSFYTFLGSTRVGLYTPGDVEAIRDWLTAKRQYAIIPADQAQAE